MTTPPHTVDAILARLGDPGLSAKAMFGAHAVYLGGRMVGIIGDGRLYVKNVPGARAALPDAPAEPPFAGAKNRYLLADGADPEAIRAALAAALAELPPTEKRKPKG